MMGIILLLWFSPSQAYLEVAAVTRWEDLKGSPAQSYLPLLCALVPGIPP